MDSASRIPTAASLLLLACASPRPPVAKPGQADATALVWHLYGRRDSPPAVRWVEGPALDCTSPGGHQGMRYGAQCLAGIATAAGLVLAWHPGDRYSTSPLAHELEHERLWRETGDADAGHTGPAWLAGGEVAKANAALAACGQ